MGFVSRIERKLEATVGDAFARVFGGTIVPQEMEAALRREATDGVRSLDGGHRLVPNEYFVTLSEEDFAKAVADPDLTADTFAKHLEGYIQEQGWQTYGDVVVRFEQSPKLHTGQFRARAAVNPDAAPAPRHPDDAPNAEQGVAPMTDDPSYRGGQGQGQGRPADDYYDDRYGRPEDARGPGGPPPGGPPPGGPPPGGAYPDQGGYPPQGGDPSYGQRGGGYPDQGGYPPQYEQRPPAGGGFGGPPPAPPGGPPAGPPPGYDQPPPRQAPPAQPPGGYGGQPGYGSDYGGDYGRPPGPPPGRHEGQPGNYGRPGYGEYEQQGGGYEQQGGYPPQQGYGQQEYGGYDQPAGYDQQPGYDQYAPAAGGADYSYDQQPGYPGQYAPTAVTLQLDDGSGRTYQLREGANVVGRGQDAQFRLPDTGVSRRHLEIRWDGQAALLSDLNSTNGTTVNNAPVQEWQLADGDVIRLGHSEIVVRMH
jgi:hypothetical protein